MCLNCFISPKYKMLLKLCFCFLLCSKTALSQRRFPDDFMFGAATAAYQVEGAWNLDGKGENIWDNFLHSRPELVKDHCNADVAADSYHNYKRDVEMIRELGLDTYRFSLSWARILPDGFINNINEAGVNYYNNLINELLKYNIQPMVTIYHWDLPQNLQKLGGFMNPLITEWFEDYACLAFTKFGDRVKLWITFNEPGEFCKGYETEESPPQLNMTGIGYYLCAKHVVIAHARAYHAYHKDFDTTGGEVGITLDVSALLPLTESNEDQLAAVLVDQIGVGVFATPIFSAESGFPEELSELVAKKSAEQGFPRSRLPTFSDEEITLIRGASDFFGLNHYTGAYVSATKNPKQTDVDISVGYYVPEDWPKSASEWLTLMPNSLYLTMKHVRDNYNDPVIYVTENGWSSHGGLEDDDRVRYLRAMWNDTLDALRDGVRVKGYMVWSLMDNFEWREGYTERFGLYEVDFSSATLERRARSSALVYKQLVRTRVLDACAPRNLTIAIDPGH